MIENKRQESEKESKEKTRGGKLLITKPLEECNTKGTEFGGQSAGSVHTLGFRIDLERKGLVEKGFVST